MSDKAKDLVKRYKDLKAGRGTIENHWEDLARVMLPGRVGFTSDPVPGERRTDDIFDGTPMQAARGLANAIESMMWPQGQKNFYIKANDDAIGDTDEAKEWLAQCEDSLTAAMMNPKARLLQARGEVNLDLSVLGSGILFTGERQKLNGLLYQALNLRDAVVLFSDEGVAEGLFRVKTYTLSQAEIRFGLDNLSEVTRKKFAEEKKPDDLVKILHAVYPRKGARPEAVMAKNLPFASCWIEMEALHEVEESGFHEFPFAVPRWDTSSGENYGRSPGMIALPDADTLQAMGETILIAGQLAADPSILVPNDGFFDEANSFPGGITYYDADIAKAMGKIPIGPLETGMNLPISRDMQKDMREQVFAAFFKNVFNLPVAGPQMTAEEIRARKEELIREVGPAFGRLDTDYTGPKVERSFNIMLRAGALPPIPDILAGQSIRFEYESPVKKIRQQIDAAAASMWVAERIDISIKTQRPDILDIVDFDEHARASAEAAQIPHKIVVGKARVEQIRAERAKAQQAQQQMAMAAQMAETAKTAGETPGMKQMLEKAGGGMSGGQAA